MIFDTIIDKGIEYINKFSNIYIRHLIKQSLSKYLEDKNDIIIKSKNIGDFIFIHINRIKFNNKILDGIVTSIKLDSFIAKDIIIKIKWKESYETSIKINSINIFYNLHIINDDYPENILYSLYDNLYKSISMKFSNTIPLSLLSTELKQDKDLLDLEDDINYLINCSKIKIKNFEIVDKTSNLKFITNSIIYQRKKRKSGDFISILSLRNNTIIDYTTILKIFHISNCSIFIKDNYDYYIKIDSINIKLSTKNNFCWLLRMYNNYIRNSDNDSDNYCKKVKIGKVKVIYYLKKIQHYWLFNKIIYNDYFLKIKKINVLNTYLTENFFKNELIGVINLVKLNLSADGYKLKLNSCSLIVDNSNIYNLKEIFLDLNNLFEKKKEKIYIDNKVIYNNFEDNEIIKKSNYICNHLKISIKDGNYKKTDEMIFNFYNIEYINIVLSNRLIKNKIHINDANILDKIKESVWNKFLYKDTNDPLFKFKWITSKDINNTILLLKICLNPIILNIDEHCIIFLLTILQNIKFVYFKDLQQDNQNDLFIKETIINEILINLSYKPVNKNIDLYNFKYRNLLSLSKIRDVDIFLNKIYLEKNLKKNDVINQIFSTWLIDLKENQYYKLLLFIDILKYFFFITCDLADNVTDLRNNNDTLFVKFKNLFSNIGISITSNILNLSTRSFIGSINLFEKLNNKDINKKVSIYNKAPSNLLDSLDKSRTDIIERYNILMNNEYNISYRIIQPLLCINEGIFNTLLGLHHSISPVDYYKKKERYNID